MQLAQNELGGNTGMWDYQSAGGGGLYVTLLSAFVASIFNGAFGLLMAWILTRYRFPAVHCWMQLMDLPFALVFQAVAGLTLASLFSVNGFTASGWRLDIKVTYTGFGIAVAMAFTSIPLVVRTVQPVLWKNFRSLNMKKPQKRRRYALAEFPKWCCRSCPPALVAMALSFTRSPVSLGGYLSPGTSPGNGSNSLMILFACRSLTIPPPARLLLVIPGFCCCCCFH